jgi:uncharacterized protein (DUF2164 family)
MSKAKPWELDSQEREHALYRVRQYLNAEHGEWGELATALLFDTFQELVGPLFYNRGVAEAQTAVAELAESFDVNIGALKRMPPSTRRGAETPSHEA